MTYQLACSDSADEAPVKQAVNVANSVTDNVTDFPILNM